MRPSTAQPGYVPAQASARGGAGRPPPVRRRRATPPRAVLAADARRPHRPRRAGRREPRARRPRRCRCGLHGPRPTPPTDPPPDPRRPPGVRDRRPCRGDRRRRARPSMRRSTRGLEGDGLAFYHVTLGDLLLATGDAAGARDGVRGGARGAARTSRGARRAGPAGRVRRPARRGDRGAGRGDRRGAPPRDGWRAAPTSSTRRGGAGDAGARGGGPGDDRGDRVARRRRPAGVYDRGLSLYLADHGLDPERAVRLASDELAVRPDIYGSRRPRVGAAQRRARAEALPMPVRARRRHAGRAALVPRWADRGGAGDAEAARTNSHAGPRARAGARPGRP